MSDNEKDYFVPEQLDDNDFEKEKLEEKKNKKQNKTKLSKSKVKNIILIILVICLIAFGVYWYVTPHEKKASEPEQVVKDFCAYLNSGNWNKVNELMDFKGYYTLGAVLEEESEYVKFDASYRKLSDSDETYNNFVDNMNVLMSIDEETLNSIAQIQVQINNIQSCNKIQGTDTLYRIIADFNYTENGDVQSVKGVVFVSNISGEYKIVYGDLIGTVLNYYQTIYMLQSNYGY